MGVSGKRRVMSACWVASLAWDWRGSRCARSCSWVVGLSVVGVVCMGGGAVTAGVGCGRGGGGVWVTGA